MKPGLEYENFAPGLKRSCSYGSIATSWFHVVGSNGSQSAPLVHGHVGFWNPAACDISMRIVTLSIEPYGSCTIRSSGMYDVTRSSSVSLPRSRSCMIEIAVSVLVMDA